MLIGALADIHGSFDAMQRAMQRHPDVPFWLCVGDVADDTGMYPEPLAPLYWIKGNNEDFDQVARFASGAETRANLHFIPNGTAQRVGPIRVAALGGTYAPTWFESPAAALPHKRRDDKRRHFVRGEVEACKRLRDVDVLLTHEAPRPFILSDDSPSGPARPSKRWDAGRSAINDVLAALKPRLHLCGHHHRFSEAVREGVRSVCIDRVERSYLLIDAETLAYQKIDQ